jgi:hypothetical protein
MRREKPKMEQSQFSIKDARGALAPDRFLSLLNGNTELSEENSLQSPIRTDAELMGRMVESIQRDEESKYAARLRTLVDEWLNSGLGPTGEEDARTRDLAKTPTAARVLQKYSRKQSVLLVVGPEGLHVTLHGGPQWTIGDSMKSPDVPLRPRSTEDIADGLFAQFCLSEWRCKLAKCRRAGCGRYFWLNHWNRLYKRGIACPGCARIRSSENSTIRARKQDHADKLARAAAAIGEWGQGARKRTPWKEYVSKRHPDIKAKSLTRWVNSGELKLPKGSENAKS